MKSENCKVIPETTAERLAIEKYGDNINSFGGQRDGFVAAYSIFETQLADFKEQLETALLKVEEKTKTSKQWCDKAMEAGAERNKLMRDLDSYKAECTRHQDNHDITKEELKTTLHQNTLCHQIITEQKELLDKYDTYHNKAQDRHFALWLATEGHLKLDEHYTINYRAGIKDLYMQYLVSNNVEVMPDNPCCFDAILDILPSVLQKRIMRNKIAERSTAPDKETPDWLLKDIENGMDAVCDYITERAKHIYKNKTTAHE